MKLFEEVAAGRAISGKDARPDGHVRLPVRADDGARAGRGIPVDEDGFRERMVEHREVSREARASMPGPPAEFVGYEQIEVLTAIVALSDLGDSAFEAKLERSPFYPAGGGQITDAGWIEHEETGARAELREAFRVGDDQTLCSKATASPRATASRPSCVGGALPDDGEPATHLLHESLRRVLGEHVQQQAPPCGPTSCASTSRTRRR